MAFSPAAFGIPVSNLLSVAFLMRHNDGFPTVRDKVKVKVTDNKLSYRYTETFSA